MQAILFQNDRALGRLILPQLHVTSVDAIDQASHDALAHQPLKFHDVDASAASETASEAVIGPTAASNRPLARPTTLLSNNHAATGSGCRGFNAHGAHSRTACSNAACSCGKESGSAEGAMKGSSNSIVLEFQQLVFDRWQPVWTDFRTPSASGCSLHIPVNAAWRASEYRLEVCHSMAQGNCAPFASDCCIVTLSV